jgi:hypothetical protein
MLQAGMDCPRITQITLIIYPQMAQMFHKWFDPRLPGGLPAQSWQADWDYTDY